MKCLVEGTSRLQSWDARPFKDTRLKIQAEVSPSELSVFLILHYSVFRHSPQQQKPVMIVYRTRDPVSYPVLILNNLSQRNLCTNSMYCSLGLHMRLQMTLPLKLWYIWSLCKCKYCNSNEMSIAMCTSCRHNAYAIYLHSCI